MNGTTVIVQPAHTPDFSVWILIPIIISIGTMAVSLYYSYRQRKREQFKIALDVSNRLQDIRKSYEEAVQNVPQVFSGNSIEKISDPTAIEALTKKYAFEILYLLNMFSILVNNKEINNFSIQLGMFRQYTDTTHDNPEIDKFIHDKVSSEVFYELDKWLKSFQAEIGKHKPELTRWMKYRRKLNIKKLEEKKKRP